MEHYTNGFAPETVFTAIVRLVMIVGLMGIGIWVIKNGFNSKADDNF